jgi:hypothetical protein
MSRNKNFTYRQTDEFEFVECPYGLDFIAVIRLKDKICIRYLFPLDKSYLIAESGRSYFKFKKKTYFNQNYKIGDLLPQWFLDWYIKTDIRQISFRFGEEDQWFYNQIQQKRNEYLKQIGLL